MRFAGKVQMTCFSHHKVRLHLHETSSQRTLYTKRVTHARHYSVNMRFCVKNTVLDAVTGVKSNIKLVPKVALDMSDWNARAEMFEVHCMMSPKGSPILSTVRYSNTM